MQMYNCKKLNSINSSVNMLIKHDCLSDLHLKSLSCIMVSLMCRIGESLWMRSIFKTLSKADCFP